MDNQRAFDLPGARVIVGKAKKRIRLPPASPAKPRLFS
jgi:hypothetical protein